MSEVERKKIRTDDFDIKNMMERIGRKGELFKPVLKKKQALGDAFEKAGELLEGDRARGARA